MQPLITRALRLTCWVGALLVATSCVQTPAVPATASEAAAVRAELGYDVLYRAEFFPERGVAVVEVEIRQARHLMRELDFSAPAERYRPLEADGELRETDRGFTWLPPAAGGVLRYEFTVSRRRGDRDPPMFDAHMVADWALLRLDHLFPPARTRALRGAQSRPQMELTGPRGWSFETRYGPVNRGVVIDELERGFVRPTGWMVAGELGIRRERIAGRRVAVAAPVDENYRRIDLLAMLNWNLPHLVEVFPDFPARLLIVGANDPMWRGGLSGPGSLYLHADRPMLSENGTSTLIHELVHVGSGFASVGGDNWIVEGIAEYYSIEIMRRSGTLSERRYERALEMLAGWGETAQTLEARRATGPIMAAAAVLMHQLDQEIVAVTGEAYNLDEVVQRLHPKRRELSLEVLLDAVESVLGHPSAVLAEAFDRA
jgi:hypothetical protein